MANRKKRQIRAEFRKNRGVRTRANDLTRQASDEPSAAEDAPREERLTGKGELSRKRTLVGEIAGGDEFIRHVDTATGLSGRVLAVKGLLSHVEAPDGKLYRCATRRLLKTLSTSERHVVAAGDLVWFRPEGQDEGIIERVEPRRGVLSRTSRGRQHIMVTNVDQILIVASAAEPYLKPNLIDRFLVTAEKVRIRPIIVINKIDLCDPADLQPLVGVFSQIGYMVMLVSAHTGQGIDRLRRQLGNRQSVVAGQSGVGKSSLLNALDPQLSLRVSAVSAENQKGKHTTTTAQLIPLSWGGYIVDTPGIRQFQLWDVIPEEVDGFYRDIRPYTSQCRFPDCTHIHESDCAVKDAVADGHIDARRYESYLHLREGDMVA